MCYTSQVKGIVIIYINQLQNSFTYMVEMLLFDEFQIILKRPLCFTIPDCRMLATKYKWYICWHCNIEYVMRCIHIQRFHSKIQKHYLCSPKEETQTLFSSWWEDDGFLCLLKADGNGDCLWVWVVGCRASRVRAQICVLAGPHSDHMLPSAQYPSEEFYA